MKRSMSEYIEPTTLTQGVTVGSVTIDNSYWPPYNTWTPYVYYWPSVQTLCSGDTHVWACEHAVKCKCGQATRKAPKCPGCGR